MLKRNVYTAEEQAMVDAWHANPLYVGWLGDRLTKDIPYPVFNRVATKELITNLALAHDYSNPLWRDEAYAGSTRWGGVIAPPFYEHVITHGGVMPKYLAVPESLGKAAVRPLGSTWTFVKPIRPGDSFRVWIGPQRLEDVTREGPDSPRMFVVHREYVFINQHDEVTTRIFRRTLTTILRPQDEGKIRATGDEYRYTAEELALVDKIADEEVIRGAEVRFWEDVSVGDELTPTSNGPVTVWDMVVELAAIGITNLPMREVRRQTPKSTVVNPVTGVTHKTVEVHLIDPVAHLIVQPQADAIQCWKEQTLGRTITNWMGDEGWLSRIDIQHQTLIPLGDAVITRGRVIKTYQEDGRSLVDIRVWNESIRGHVTDIGIATVELRSRERTSL